MSTVRETGTNEPAGDGLEDEFVATSTTIGGRYRVRRRLDREGGGLVVLADDDVTGRPVVIDFVDVADGADDDAVRLLRDAAAATLVLKDPAVLHTTDFVQHQHRLGVVSEYVEGNDLATLLRRGPLAPSEASRIGGALARALASMHHAGIAHGLLTPRDVLIDAAGDVHVANTALGATGLVAPAPVTLAVYGAPEQLAGQGGGAAADLYSLGVLLYEMVVGQPPFSDWDATVLTQRKLHEPSPVPSEAGAVVPTDYDALTSRLLDPRPVARPDADEAAVALARLETPMIARTPAPIRRRRSMSVVTTEEVTDSRRDLGWWVAATVALALGIVVLVAVLLNRDDPKRVLVPNVVGRPAVVAIAQLRNDGFRVSTLQAPNNGVLPGVVMNQSPAPGRRVKQHAAVVVTISTGPLASTSSPPPLIIEQPPTASTSASTSTSTSSSTTTTTTAP